MRILWSIHLYPPKHNCGSEWMAHHINRYLLSKGHEVRVLLHDAKKYGIHSTYDIDGVRVLVPGTDGKFDDHIYRWADVILTHLDYTQFSIVQARSVKKPIVHFVHNDIAYPCIQNADRGQYVVYNSKWISDLGNYKWPYTIVTPPCDYDYYNVCDNPYDNEFITLISLNRNKGSEIFYRIAKEMPDRKFLGVVGSYDDQIVWHSDNVSIHPNTKEIRDVYKKTRVLLMPSAYESWGRTATEAMCSGIPVIACETPGLKENLGNAGLFVPKRKHSHKEKIVDGTSYDIGPILKQIRKLDDKKYYSKMSDRCRARAKELSPKMEDLEQFLLNTKF